MVAACEGEAAEYGPNTGRGGVAVALVLQVGVMHQPRKARYRGIGEPVSVLDDFEGAEAPLMGKLGARDVKHRRIRGAWLISIEEDEFGLAVNKALDQPGAGRAVDVTSHPRSPLHAGLATDVRRANASRATTPRGDRK